MIEITARASTTTYLYKWKQLAVSLTPVKDPSHPQTALSTLSFDFQWGGGGRLVVADTSRNLLNRKHELLYETWRLEYFISYSVTDQMIDETRCLHMIFVLPQIVSHVLHSTNKILYIAVFDTHVEERSQIVQDCSWASVLSQVEGIPYKSATCLTSTRF